MSNIQEFINILKNKSSLINEPERQYFENSIKLIQSKLDTGLLKQAERQLNKLLENNDGIKLVVDKEKRERDEFWAIFNLAKKEQKEKLFNSEKKQNKKIKIDKTIPLAKKIVFEEAKQLFQKLFERTILDIHDFPINEINSDNALQTFELFYELEYKFNQLKNNSFMGLPKRREALLKIIENTASKINKVIAESFIEVFSEWLDRHAILDPHQWATSRYQDYADIEFQYLMSEVFTEYNQYSGPDYFDTTIRKIIEDIENYPNLQKLLNFGAVDYFQTELDNLGWREFYLIYSGLLSGVNNGDDFRDFLSSGKLPSTDFLMNFVEIFCESSKQFSEAIENLFNYVSVNEEDLVIELYENLVFPVWFEKWRMEGIEDTRNTVEETYQTLQKINTLPIEKQFMQINIAVNTTHQTGSMLEYYYEKFEVGKFELDVLSDMDTTEWNRELQEIGVEIAEKKSINKNEYVRMTEKEIQLNIENNKRILEFNNLKLAEIQEEKTAKPRHKTMLENILNLRKGWI